MKGKLAALVAAIVLATVAGTAEAVRVAGYPTVAELRTNSVLIETAPAEALKTTVSPRTLAANSASFTDAGGDSGPGPDMVGVSVSSDDASTITFRVDIPNRPTVPASLALALFVDAVSNPSTGNVEMNGAEYMFLANGNSLSFGRWNGSTSTSRACPRR